MRILLTGATGALGADLLLRLLTEGHEVICLTRPSKNKSAEERIRDIVGNIFSGNVSVLEGNICDLFCGLSQDQIDGIGPVDRVIHSAASVEFDESKKEITWDTNFHGVRRLLDVLDQLTIGSLHHVSTAYISGGLDIFSEKDIDIGQSGRNPYETSKLAGEELVRSWSQKKDIPLSVYRPSIIVGHSKTGVTRTFDGYYGFFGPLWGLKRRQKIEGTWKIGVFIKCSNESTINLVPSDWLIDTMVPLIIGKDHGRTYNLTHPNPPKVQWVIETSLAILGIEPLGGVGISSQSYPDTDQDERIQKMINRGSRRYDPYVIERETIFLSGNAQKIIGDKGYKNPPPITKKLLEMLLRYATAEWSTLGHVS